MEITQTWFPSVSFNMSFNILVVQNIIKDCFTRKIFLDTYMCWFTLMLFYIGYTYTEYMPYSYTCGWSFYISRSIWSSTCRRLKVFAERDVYRCSSTKSRVCEERFPGSHRDKERKRRLEKRGGARSARDANRYISLHARLIQVFAE